VRIRILVRPGQSSAAGSPPRLLGGRIRLAEPARLDRRSLDSLLDCGTRWQNLASMPRPAAPPPDLDEQPPEPADGWARRLVFATYGLAALGAWTLWGWLVIEVPPSGVPALIAFYALFFVAMSLSAAILFWWLARAPAARRWTTPSRYLGHAMLLSGLLVFALWLQSLRMLTLLNAVLLLGIFAMLELMLVLTSRGR
jgi:hypothetical protein